MIGLQLCITPTDRFGTVDGAPCLVWEGRTPLGSTCLVYVRWLDVPHGQDNREFDALELDGVTPPEIVTTRGAGTGDWIRASGAMASITPPGNPARGGKRDEDEEAKD